MYEEKNTREQVFNKTSKSNETLYARLKQICGCIQRIFDFGWNTFQIAKVSMAQKRTVSL